MELDWTTFLLEVINFLILVWLLKRFLYQPVLNVIEERRQKIAAELLQAAATRDEARALQAQYEGRLVDWEKEKRSASDALEQTFALKRKDKLKQLDEELDQQRLKRQARDEQQQELWRSQAETEALRLGRAFVARLLQRLAGPEVDARLRQLFIEQLAELPGEELARLREGWQGNSAAVEVLSATPLEAQQQQAIRRALEKALGTGEGTYRFNTDEKLIAGLRVSIVERVLGANLQDELQFFGEAAAHGG